MTLKDAVSKILLDYGVHYKSQEATERIMKEVTLDRKTELEGIRAELGAELWAHELPPNHSATMKLLEFKLSSLNGETRLR